MITDVVAYLTEVSSRHQALAYLLVGLLALAEAIPLVGVLVPGSLLIVAISALVPAGSLDVVPLVVVALLGAVAGDGVSFWLGRRLADRRQTHWPFRQYPGLVAQAERLFRRHGGKSVLLARFVQGPRGFVPLIAGASGMSTLRFYAFNVASAMLWAPSHIVAGILLGTSLHLVASIAGRLALFLVLVAGLVWLVAWLMRRIILGAALRGLVRLQARLVVWSESRDSWLRRQCLGLLQATRAEGRALLWGAVVLTGSLWLFLGILEDVLTGDPLVQANRAVFHFLQGLRTDWGDALMVVVSELGDGMVLAAVGGAVAAWLLWRRAWQAVGYWLAAVGGAVIFAPVIQGVMPAPRPVTGEEIGRWEYPVDHSVIGVVLFGFLGYLVARELRQRQRRWLVVGIGLLVTLVAFSRLYLGAHWLSGVVAGMAIGAAWIALLAVAYGRHRPRSLSAGGLIGVGLVTLAIAWPVQLSRQFSADAIRFAPHAEQRALSRTDWLAGGYRSLPARRIDLGGEEEEAIILQWAGEPSALIERLVAHGWRVAPAWTLDTALRWLDPGEAFVTLPVLPRLHDGRASMRRLVLPVEADAAARVVLHLWPSGVRLDTATRGGGMPLWLGAVVSQRRTFPLGLFPVERSRPAEPGVVDRLAAGLAGGRRVEGRAGAVLLGWASTP